MAGSIAVKSLYKNYGALKVISNWNMNINGGEKIALLGPSGSGKTTFLRLIAGLEPPSSGEITISTTKIGFVFQEPRLIPWRSVSDNLLFVNEHGHADAILSKLRLCGFENYFPSQLSGGMQQRVNLARAMMIDPDLLIMDEAFSSLDLNIKLDIITDIVSQCEERQLTMITVTHDLKEALLLADRIFIISNSPARILHEFPVDLQPHARNIANPQLLSLEAQLLPLMLGTRHSLSLKP